MNHKTQADRYTKLGGKWVPILFVFLFDIFFPLNQTSRNGVISGRVGIGLKKA